MQTAQHGAANQPDLHAVSRIPQNAKENMAFVNQLVQQNQLIDPQMRQALANAPRAQVPANLHGAQPSIQPRAPRQSSLPQTAPVMEAVHQPTQSFRDAQEFVRQQVGQNPVLDPALKQNFGVPPRGIQAPQQKPNTAPQASQAQPPNRHRRDEEFYQRHAQYDAQRAAYEEKLRRASMPIPAHLVTPPPQLSSPPPFARPSIPQQRLNYHDVQTPQYLQKTSSAISMPSVGMPKAPAMPSVKLPKITQQSAPRSVEVPKPLSLTQQPSPMDRVTPEIAGAASKTASLLDKVAKYYGNGFGVTRHYDSSIASAPIPQSYQNRPTGYAAEGWDDSKPMQRHSAVMAEGGSALMDFGGRPNPLDMGGLQFNEIFLASPAANAPKAPDPLIQMMQSQQQQQGIGQEQGDPSNPEVQQQQESADVQQQPGAETDSSMGGSEQAKVSHAKRASGESIGGNIQELVGLGVLGVPAAYELIHGHPKPEDEQSTFHRTMQSPTTKSLAEILGLGILAQPYATNLYRQLTAPKVASPKTASWGGAAMGAGAGLVGGLLAGGQATHEDKDGNIVGPSASSIILPTLMGGAAGYGLGKWHRHRNQPHLDALDKERKILSGVEHRYRQTYPKLFNANKKEDIHFPDPINNLYHDHQIEHLRDLSRISDHDPAKFRIFTFKHPDLPVPQSKLVFSPQDNAALQKVNTTLKENPYKRNWFSAPGALAAGIGTGALVNRMNGGQEIVMTKEEMEKESAANVKENLSDAIRRIYADFDALKGMRGNQMTRKKHLVETYGVSPRASSVILGLIQNAKSKEHFVASTRHHLQQPTTSGRVANLSAVESIPSAHEQPSLVPQESARTPSPQTPASPEPTPKPTSEPMSPPSNPMSSPLETSPPASAAMSHPSATLPSQSQHLRVDQNAHTSPPKDDLLQAVLGANTPAKPSAPPTPTNAQPTEDDLFREMLAPTNVNPTKPDAAVVVEHLKQKASAIPPAVSSEKAPATTTKPTQATPATSPAQKGSPFHYGYHAALPAALGAAYGTTRGYLNPAVREDSSEVNPLALGLGTAATTSLGGLAGQQLGNLLHYPNAGAAIGSILGGLGGHEALRRLM